MKILIDGRMLWWTGVGRYTVELLRNLEQLDRANHYIVIMREKDARIWQPTAPNFSSHFTDIAPYTFEEQLKLPRLIRTLKPDLVHFVSPNLPLLYNDPYVVTVHDLTLLKFKNVKTSALKYQVKFWAFRLVLRHAVSAAKAVITPTNYGAKDIESVLKLGILSKTVTTPLAANLPSATQASSPISGRYLLCVGNFYPYRNLIRLVESFAAIQKSHTELRLVFAGQLGGQSKIFAGRLKKRVEGLGLNDAIVFIDSPGDEQLAALYTHATAFVFPSLYEGFGLPPLEAMSYGAPVAAANTSCLPEVLGDNAVYFDPLDTASMTSVINGLLNDSAKLAALKTAGPTYAKTFSWKRTAEQTLAVYHNALDELK